MRLIRQLHESGYNKTDVLNVFNFIDWVLGLPKALELEFWRELQAYEEERKVPYITSVEKIGYDRGRLEEREGEAQRSLARERSLISLQLEQQVGSLSEPLTDQVNKLAPDQLQALAIALLRFESIADLTIWLEHQG